MSCISHPIYLAWYLGVRQGRQPHGQPASYLNQAWQICNISLRSTMPAKKVEFTCKALRLFHWGYATRGADEIWSITSLFLYIFKVHTWLHTYESKVLLHSTWPWSHDHGRMMCCVLSLFLLMLPGEHLQITSALTLCGERLSDHHRGKRGVVSIFACGPSAPRMADRQRSSLAKGVHMQFQDQKLWGSLGITVGGSRLRQRGHGAWNVFFYIGGDGSFKNWVLAGHVGPLSPFDTELG